MTKLMLLVAWAGLAMGWSAGERQGAFEWRGRVAAGQLIEIKGVNGDVRAEGSNGTEVEVVARKTSRRSDPQGVKLQVLPHADGITVCAVYPSESNRPNECQPGARGRMNVSKNDVRVNFIVRVPWGVRFVGRTVNGEVAASSMRSEVEAYTVNGRVSINTSGSAQAETVNGNILAQVGDTSLTRPLSFKTVNGGIVLDLPPTASAELRKKMR